MPELIFEMYKDLAGKYRWRLKNRKGEILASSERAYNSKADCRESAREVTAVTEIVDLDNLDKRLQKAHELMTISKPIQLELKPDSLVKLDRDVVAVKTVDGKIVLYEGVK